MRYYIIEMPRTELITYKEKSGDVPLLRWLESLPDKVRYKWEARFESLEQFGFELRRPICDYLRDDIYELRLRNGTINYRVLYAFVGRNVVLLSHGFSKEGKVPDIEINRAIINRRNYLINPSIHTFKCEDKDEKK
jgi:phage-related protein